ncbi:transcriptional regulator [Motiliproteus coralliicola]|uniref:Transcriptional regulator n=1 Tax=Motiliproteus coralliicola TaxID=2283196 RepID=A0A369WER7_9GAMM|nr:Rho-binding antiterminator [Motiliproteus coralliicola]RDE19841.1 transcriptional regulator [Motiliproteus coralliicola]
MISCEIHDYVEIVCTYRYPLKLVLKSGEIIEGIGLDTRLDEARRECILLESDGATNLVVLSEISVLEVCVENPHVRRVSFDTESAT